MQDDFTTERQRAVEICYRMDGRVGLRSMAAYWPQHLSRAELAEAQVAERETEADMAEVLRFVRWGLEHHRQAMCAWAESAAALGLSDTYVRGWEQTLEAWRNGAPEPEDPVTALLWLVVMWDRARRDASS